MPSSSASLATALLMAATMGLAQAPKPPAAPVDIWLARARTAVQDAPPELQPDLMVQIAMLEPTRHDAALQDLTEAFRLSHVFPRPASIDDSKTAAWERATLPNLQAQIFAQLGAQHASFEVMHALVLKADVPRGPLYDSIILSDTKRQMQSLDPTTVFSAELAPPTFDILALVRECVAADGSFPYLGAAQAVARIRLAPTEKVAIARLGYTAAAHETDVHAAANAAGFLQAGHRATPQLDAQLVDADVALLQLFAEASDPASAATRSSFGRAAMSLLREIDPRRADDLAASLPMFAAPARANAGPPTPMPMNGSPGTSTFQNPADAQAAVQNAEGAPDVQARFRALLAAAAFLIKTDPAASARAVDDIMAAENADLLAANLPAAARLALQLHARLGREGDARTLVGQIIPAAVHTLEAAQAQYDAASADDRVPINRTFFGSAANTTPAIFAIAAQIDRGAAEQAATSLKAPLYAPLVFAQLAQPDSPQ